MTEDLFWDRIRQLLHIPREVGVHRAVEGTMSASSSLKGTIGIPNVTALTGERTHGRSDQTSTTQTHSYSGPDGPQLLDHLRSQDIRLVVDDFHYIEPQVQKLLAQQFKESARRGTTIVLVSISERSDQAIRANPDLRGRLVTIDIPFWRDKELRAIPEKGFRALNVASHNDVVNIFTAESVGSPQLMQALCLELCHFWKLEDAYPELRTMTCPPGAAQNFLRKTVALANCKTAFDLLESGPKVHGSPRKVYRLRNGKEGDIYAVILRSLAVGPASLSLRYQEINERVASIVDGQPPGGASVVSALAHTDEIVQEKMALDRVLEWDAEKDVLNVLDPYFLYYLRWSGIAAGL